MLFIILQGHFYGYSADATVDPKLQPYLCVYDGSEGVTRKTTNATQMITN